jgi:hypothetical protein
VIDEIYKREMAVMFTMHEQGYGVKPLLNDIYFLLFYMHLIF